MVVEVMNLFLDVVLARESLKEQRREVVRCDEEEEMLGDNGWCTMVVSWNSGD